MSARRTSFTSNAASGSSCRSTGRSGRSNVDVLGMELATSLEQVEKAIQRDRPDLSETAAGDGTVTLVFTDIVDSTVLTARLGDRAWMETVRLHHDVIGETVSAHGGRVVEIEGDGSMLAFASARRAVFCAKEIQTAITALSRMPHRRSA